MEKVTNYLSNALQKYLEDLSSRTCTPGGGSAAALAAALGAGLNLMVIRYSKEKTGASEGNKELKETELRENENLKMISSLIDKDCEVFSSLMRTLSEKNDDAEGKYIASAEVPMEICRRSARSMDTACYLAEKGSKNLLTDVASAAHILKAAFSSAKVNVEINLKYIENIQFLKDTKMELEKIEKDTKNTYDNICSRLKVS